MPHTSHPSHFTRWRNFLFTSIDPTSLALFRIAFGFLMFIEICRFFAFGWIDRYYIEPSFFFSYIDFIKPWPGNGMYWHVGALGILAIFIMLGVFYRMSAWLFFLGFTYLFLLDKAFYLNHFYLICLISFLLAISPAHATWSLDNILPPWLPSFPSFRSFPPASSTVSFPFKVQNSAFNVPHSAVLSLRLVPPLRCFPLQWPFHFLSSRAGHPQPTQHSKDSSKAWGEGRVRGDVQSSVFGLQSSVFRPPSSVLHPSLRLVLPLRWLPVQWPFHFLSSLTPHSSIPFWPIFILRAQVIIAYFYGGIAKLNEDWLRGEPQRHWMQARSDYLVGDIITQEWFVQLLTYGGIIIDLTVGFLLLWTPTFWLGAFLVFAFNLTNTYLFSIGIFPWLMIGTLILFGRPDWPRRYFSRSKPTAQPSKSTVTPTTYRGYRTTILLCVIHIYLLLQLLIPLRHFLYPGIVHWTEEGHRFSWHMKLRDKEGYVRYFKTDPETGQRQRIEYQHLINDRQNRKLPGRPDMILQLAHHLADQEQQTTGTRPIITVQAIASVNYRPFQYLIDPEVDLASQPLTLKPAPWNVPLKPLEPSTSPP